MAKRKVSERDFLIEQCLYDAYCEREGVINEGFVDDFKANARAAGEWLKQNTKDRLKFRKNSEVLANRKNAAVSGKIKSYAGSLAKTMSDFKKSGGTLGRNISNIDDVINRLDLVSQGKLPRGVAGSNWAEQGQQNDYSSEAPSNTNSAASSRKNTQSNASQPSKSSANTDSNGYFTTGASAPLPSKANSTSSNNSSVTNRNSNQTTTAQQAEPSQQAEPAQQSQENIDANNQQQVPANSPETQSKPLSKRDIARKKRQEKIFKRKEKEAEKAKIERAKRIKKAGKAARKSSEAQNTSSPESAQQAPSDVNSTPATPNSQENPSEPAAPASDSNKMEITKANPQNTPNSPAQKAMLDTISSPNSEIATTKNRKGTYVGDINSINQQNPMTGSSGDTQSGLAYDGYNTYRPDNSGYLPNDEAPAQNVSGKPEKQIKTGQLSLPQPEESSQGEPTNNETSEPAAPAEKPVNSEAQKRLLDTIKPNPIKKVKPGAKPVLRRSVADPSKTTILKRDKNGKVYTDSIPTSEKGASNVPASEKESVGTTKDEIIQQEEPNVAEPKNVDPGVSLANNEEITPETNQTPAPAPKEDPLKGVVPNHEYGLSPREKRRRRDHALGKERRADKIERQKRNNAKSAAKSQQVQQSKNKKRAKKDSLAPAASTPAESLETAQPEQAPTTPVVSSPPAEKIKKDPLANLRSNVPANAKKGLKLKTGPTSKKRRRILTAKNALDNERSQKAMQNLVNSNPDMFMFDSYIPQHNTNAQLSMLNSII